MSSIDGDMIETSIEPTRLKRWEFRKKKKLEKRHKRRELNAEKNKPAVPIVSTPTEIEVTIEKQKYEQQKALWEEREERFRIIEFAKKAAREKQEKAKALSQVY
jgi:hypothetical protein